MSRKPDLQTFVVACISLVKDAVTICTLGAVYPSWDISYLLWHGKRRMQRYQKKGR